MDGEQFNRIMNLLYKGEIVTIFSNRLTLNKTRIDMSYHDSEKMFVLNINDVKLRCDKIEYKDNLIWFYWKGEDIGWVDAYVMSSLE